MPREKKVEIINQLADMLSKSSIVIATNYRGLSVGQMNGLRRQLQGMGIQYRVVKNTLARFAAEKAGKQGLSLILDGPTALAFGYGSITEPARALADYLRSSKSTLGIRGGLLDERVLSAEEVLTLSTLPSKEVLISRLLGGMQGPILALLNTLNANMQAFLRALQARIQQMKGEQDARA